MTSPTSTGRDPRSPSASLRTSCVRCGRLAEPDRNLATHPLCPACVARTASDRPEPSPHLHPLTHAEIDLAALHGVAGSYALGYLEGGAFVAFYVGRADANLNAALHGWVGVDAHRSSWAGAAPAWRRGARPSFPPSDTPVMREIATAVDAGYTHFRLSYAHSARAAFEGECASYHALGEGRLDNAHHPTPSDGADWECPHAPHFA